jgi:hypothetical protein
MKKVFLLLSFLFLNSLLYGQVITTIAGGGTGAPGSGDGGPATAARIGYTGGFAIDKYGNTYIADGNNQRVRKVDAVTGIISTVAGIGTAGFSGDGGSATAARFNFPAWISFDTAGNYYIADANNFRIRKVDIATDIVTTYAGTGTLGYSGDGGPATAADIYLGNFTCDPFGNIYMEDGASYRVRKIDASGVITTVAGTGSPGSTGDGGSATAATFNAALSSCSNASGNIWVQDNWTLAVRKINFGTGIVTKVAGAGDSVASPYSGDGYSATASHFGSFGICVDDTGNLYITDYVNNRIEKVDTSGIIHTVAGNGTGGHSGDGGPATAAEIYHPEM